MALTVKRAGIEEIVATCVFSGKSGEDTLQITGCNSTGTLVFKQTEHNTADEAIRTTIHISAGDVLKLADALRDLANEILDGCC